MRTCTRRLEFDAGHRLIKHESKCRNVHGHRYVLDVIVGVDALDGVGRVVDFSVIKGRLGTWIDDNLDHGYIAEGGDPIVDAIRAAGLKVFVISAPPTVENLAAFLFDVASNFLNPVARVVGVRLYETPNCWADYPGPGESAAIAAAPAQGGDR